MRSENPSSPRQTLENIQSDPSHGLVSKRETTENDCGTYWLIILAIIGAIVLHEICPPCGRFEEKIVDKIGSLTSGTGPFNDALQANRFR